MKKNFIYSLIVLILPTTIQIAAQSKLVIDDQTHLVTPEVESFLSERLKTHTIELTSIVDFREKCDYWFGSLYQINQEFFLSIKDCSDKIAGTKNLFKFEWF